MALAPGTRLGPYEVTAQIGVGGMGEVYRATDTNLARQVAIKVLPDAVSHDAERLARFDREAKTLAALNHSNIAQIYGLEKADGVTALVMELVEGPTLADRIGQGPIPVDEALPIAKQIAEALEAAHEQGIIHRDLKPANIKVRDDGTVKVLDFGLAKAMDPVAGSSPNLSMSPTITTPAMTQMGMILGTAAYMSPEQARGKPVDRRADIWAFGCVLYEMLAGRRAFQGDEIADVLGAVIHKSPDFDALPASVPSSVRRILRRALEKERRERLDSAAVLRLDLQEAQRPWLAAPSGESSGARAWSWIWPVTSGALVIVAALAFWAPWRVATPNPSVTRFAIAPPPGAEFGANSVPVISPDGGAVVFRAVSEDGMARLWLRPMDGLEARPLPGTEIASENSVRPQLGTPVWSPDGCCIAFRLAGALKTLELATGTVRTLCDACGSPMSWGRRGWILTSGLGRVSESGQVGSAAPPGMSIGAGYASFLPDGQHFLFQAEGSEGGGVYVGSLDDSSTNQTPRLVIPTGNSPLAYVPASDRQGGYVLFADDDRLMAQVFDADRLSTVGEPLVVVTDLARGGGGGAMFSASATGTLVYRAGDAARVLTWFDRAGHVDGTLGETQAGVELSPDGAAVVAKTTAGLVVIDLSRGLRTAVGRATADNGIWDADRRRLIFRNRAPVGPMGPLFTVAADGSEPEKPLLESDAGKLPWDVSPDGRSLLYSVLSPETGWDLWLLSLTDQAESRPLVQAAGAQVRAQFSPDGKWVAYQESRGSGPERIYVSELPDSGPLAGREAVDDGGQPRWRGDGHELYYRRDDRAVVAVDVEPGGTFRVGAPRVLFVPDGPGPGVTSNAYFDVTPDGQQFLVTTYAEANVNAPIQVVLNFLSTIGR